VIDIVDTHDTFKRQWYKRRSLYKKADYRVEWTNSDAYFDKTVDEEESEYSGSEDDDIVIDTECEPTKFAKNRILSGMCLMEDD